MPRTVKLLAAIAAVLIAAAAVVVPASVRLLHDDDALAADLEDDLRAQSSAPLAITRTADGSALRAVGTRPGSPIQVGGADPAGTFLDRYGRLLGTGTTDLVPISTEPSLGGGSATRYQQTVDGVPVFGGQVSVQVDADGGVLSSMADLSPAADGVGTTPRVSPAEARRAAVAGTARATGADPSTLIATEPEPWIYDASVIGPGTGLPARLTWRTEVTSTATPVRQLVLVDAQQGTIALSFDQLAAGVDRRVCDAANVRQTETCGEPFTRVEGEPPVPGAGGADEVNLVYDYSGATYDFYSSRFGRDGIADDGAPVVSKVRFCKIDPVPGPTTSCPYNNAFWNGQQLTFGQGFARADDVVAHELTHGVIEHTADLFYWYQSGAINESMSDVFGELVDLTDGLGNDTVGVRWLIGEDLPGGALRSMSNPGTFGDPDRMTSAAYTPDADQLDGGGVHTNSGVGNRTAALITDGGTISGHPPVVGIGVDKAAAVYYEALTTLLTSGSDYADLGVALPQACANLVAGAVAGLTATDCTRVQAAVVATELAIDPPNASAPDAPVCTGGDVPTDLFADDLENAASGNWEKTHTNPGIYNWEHPAPSYARFATSGTGNFWGADTGDPKGNGPAGSTGEFGDMRIAMTSSVALPAGSTPYFHFRHAYGFESDANGHWDGGVVEYSVNGGASWVDLGPKFDVNGYTDTLTASGSTNPLKNRMAFTAESRGYRSSRANLGPLAGQSIRFRFRVGEDQNVGSYGWFVDDIRIYTCGPLASVSVSQTAEPSSVVAGDDIDVQVSVHNDGVAVLHGVDVANTQATGCDATLPVLPPDATDTIECTYTTGDPDDIGTWSNVVSVTATELPTPMTSEPATVEVEAPAPSVDVALAADETMVTAGAPIHLHATVHNDGNVPVTGGLLTVAGCTEPLTDLALDAEVTVDCDHPTVDPDDIGPWSATATVDADGFAAPIDSNPVEVDVLAPGTPGLTLTQTADDESVGLDEPVTLHLTVENTGNVPLHDAVLDTPQAPDCETEAITNPLPIGGQDTIDCSHTPTAVGQYTSTASVTTAEVTAPVFAEPVSVDVRDVLPPAVTLEAPVDGAVYSVGQVVAAKFSCHDAHSGIVKCKGDVATGQPIDTSTPGEHTFTVVGKDGAGNYSEVIHTYTVATRRPDGRIRQGAAGTTVGDGRYNLIGVSQTRIARIARGNQVTFFVTVQNDGTHSEAFRVRGQPSTTNYTVRYFSAGVDITLKVRNGTYQTPVLAPGAARTIKVVVTVGAGARAGSQAERLVTVSSAKDLLRKDAVRFIVKRT